MRVIEVQDLLGEIGAIEEKDIEVTDVLMAVESSDQRVVLLSGRGDIEAPDTAVVGGANQFGPLTAGNFMLGTVGNNRLQVLAAPCVAQFEFQPRRNRRRNLGGVIDRVEIGNQRNGQPVVSVNAMIAAEDHAGFSFMARTEVDGGVGANVVEVDGRMPGRVHGPEPAKGLLEQQGGIGAGRGAGAHGGREKERGSAKCYQFEQSHQGLMPQPFGWAAETDMTNVNPPGSRELRSPISGSGRRDGKFSRLLDARFDGADRMIER